MSCPYKTPGSYLLHSTASAIASVLGCTVGHSKTVCMFWTKAQWSEPWWSRGNIMAFLKRVPCKLPGTLVADTSHLGQVMVHLFMTSTHQVYTQLLGVPSTAGCGLGWQRALQDLRCISWALVTSPEKTIHLSTLESLATMVELADFDPALVVDCLNILIGCVKVINGTVVVTQGSEKLTTVSAMCLLCTFSHLLVMDPKSGVLGDVHQLYSTVFPPTPILRASHFNTPLVQSTVYYIQTGTIHGLTGGTMNHPAMNTIYFLMLWLNSLGLNTKGKSVIKGYLVGSSVLFSIPYPWTPCPLPQSLLIACQSLQLTLVVMSQMWELQFLMGAACKWARFQS